MRIYSRSSQELAETAPFVIVNLDKVDFLYARDDEEATAPGLTRSRRAAARAQSLRRLPMYQVDLLIPTARFVFSVEGDAVDVLPEHRSPEAYGQYRRVAWPPAGGRHDNVPEHGAAPRAATTILVDPGLHLQNEPVLRALEARGLSPADMDQVVLTHAHLDHAGACADVLLPVTTHRLETRHPTGPQ